MASINPCHKTDKFTIYFPKHEKVKVPAPITIHSENNNHFHLCIFIQSGRQALFRFAFVPILYSRTYDEIKKTLNNEFSQRPLSLENLRYSVGTHRSCLQSFSDGFLTYWDECIMLLILH